MTAKLPPICTFKHKQKRPWHKYNKLVFIGHFDNVLNDWNDERIFRDLEVLYLHTAFELSIMLIHIYLFCNSSVALIVREILF